MRPCSTFFPLREIGAIVPILIIVTETFIRTDLYFYTYIAYNQDDPSPKETVYVVKKSLISYLKIRKICAPIRKKKIGRIIFP